MKNKFVKSTIILIIGSLITKVLGLFIRIIFTRIATQKSLNLYSIILPTYSLIITLAQLGLPNAISTIVAQNKNSNKTILLSIVPIVLLINTLIIFIIFFSAPFISNTLLKNQDAYYPIISISFIIPFISISSIIRGYFFGIQKMFPHSLSNIVEQIVRLFLILLVIPRIIKYGHIYVIVIFILLNIISELVSIIIFLSYIPRKIVINKKDFIPNRTIIKDTMNIAIPTTSSRIIGNIGYFFEPIILTNTLSILGYTNNFILTEYSTYNMYVLPLLTIPSFFILALNTALIPEISKYKNNKYMIKKRLKQSIIFCILIGLISNTFVFINTGKILHFVFNTSRGINYIRLLSPFFIFLYIEGPLSSTLQALNYAKYTMKTTIITTIIKLLSLFVFSLLNIGIYGLLISEIINIFLVIGLNSIKIKKILD